MRGTLKAGTRVRFTDGRIGTVKYDAGSGWRTASVEFDDEKGVIIQKEKTDLTPVEGKPVSSALARMVEKLDTRPRGHLGYVTKRDELIAILSELSPHVSVAILEENQEFNSQRGDKDISVEIKFGFTLERDLL